MKKNRCKEINKENKEERKKEWNKERKKIRKGGRKKENKKERKKQRKKKESEKEKKDAYQLLEPVNTGFVDDSDLPDSDLIILWLRSGIEYTEENLLYSRFVYHNFASVQIRLHFIARHHLIEKNSLVPLVRKNRWSLSETILKLTRNCLIYNPIRGPRKIRDD